MPEGVWNARVVELNMGDHADGRGEKDEDAKSKISRPLTLKYRVKLLIASGRQFTFQGHCQYFIDKIQYCIGNDLHSDSTYNRPFIFQIISIMNRAHLWPLPSPQVRAEQSVIGSQHNPLPPTHGVRIVIPS